MKRKIKQSRKTVRKLILMGETPGQRIHAAIWGKEPIDSPEKELAASWATVRKIRDKVLANASATPEERAAFAEAVADLQNRCVRAMLEDNPQFFRDLAAAMEWYKRHVKGQPMADEERLKLLGLLAVKFWDKKLNEYRPLTKAEIRKAVGITSDDKHFYADLAELELTRPKVPQ